jgi:hypothetical protein
MFMKLTTANNCGYSFWIKHHAMVKILSNTSAIKSIINFIYKRCSTLAQKGKIQPRVWEAKFLEGSYNTIPNITSLDEVP